MILLNNSHGGIGGALLFLFVIFTAMTSVIYKTSSGLSEDSSVQSSLSKLVSQAEFIHSKVLQCVITYSDGNPTYLDYPSIPNGSNIKDLTCPGGSQLNIWTDMGGTGIIYSSPDNMSDWVYNYSSTEISLEISAANGNDLGRRVVDFASKNYSDNASRVINDGNTLQIIFATF